MTKKLLCAVVGTGYLGRFHAQKYKIMPNVELVGVYDHNKKHALDVAQELDVKNFDSLSALLENTDAVSVVVSTKNHFQIAKQCLIAKKHVLLEKPMTETADEAKQLIKLESTNNVILQIGYLERFNPVFDKLFSMKLNPKSIDCKRLAPFNRRGSDVNVILDVMIHDLDWILQIIKYPVTSIQAKGIAVMTNQTDIANVRLTFANGSIANITASRIHQSAERSALIIDNEQYIQADFLQKTINIFAKSNNEIFPGILDLHQENHSFSNKDALYEEISSFTQAIMHNTTPKVTSVHGLESLKLALEINKIIIEQENQYEIL